MFSYRHFLPSFYRIYRLLRYFYYVVGNRTDIFTMVIKGYPSSATTSNLIAFLLQLGDFLSSIAYQTRAKIHCFSLQRLLQLREGASQNLRQIRPRFAIFYFPKHARLESDRSLVRMQIRRSVIEIQRMH